MKASCRFLIDAFLRVSFSNLSSSKFVHFVLLEITFTKYCIYSNKLPPSSYFKAREIKINIEY